MTFEDIFPHSPDVYERVNSDGGFSKGWGMHFMPIEDKWLDVHTHVGEEASEDIGMMISRYLCFVKEFRLTRIAVILPMLSRYERKDDYLQNINKFLIEVRKNVELLPFLYIDYKDPDACFIEEAVNMGISGVKLHNAPIITEGGDHKVWLSPAWNRVFKEIEKHNLPVLWHVTQRLTDSPYTGGSRNAYWKDGWEKGITYTNEDLLQIFLQVVEAFSGINFISAHQLHLGWDRLSMLFDSYPNLYTDTSVGCRVNRFDTMYEHDIDYIRTVFINYQDRILFGTDAFLENAAYTRYFEELYNSYFRFIKQLHLPHDVLQKVAWQNAEKILGLESGK